MCSKRAARTVAAALAAAAVAVAGARADTCTSVCVSTNAPWVQTNPLPVEWYSSYFSSSSVSIEIREGAWQQEVTDCRNPPGPAVATFDNVANTGAYSITGTPSASIGGSGKQYYLRVYSGATCMLGPPNGFSIAAYTPPPSPTTSSPSPTPTATTSSSPPTPTDGGSSSTADDTESGSSNLAVVLGSVLGTVGGLFIVACVLLVAIKRHNQRKWAAQNAAALERKRIAQHQSLTGAGVQPFPPNSTASLRDIDSVLTLADPNGSTVDLERNDVSGAASSGEMRVAASPAVPPALLVVPTMALPDPSASQESLETTLSSPVLPPQIEPTLAPAMSRAPATELVAATGHSAAGRAEPVISTNEAHLIAQTFRRELLAGVTSPTREFAAENALQEARSSGANASHIPADGQSPSVSFTSSLSPTTSVQSGT